MSTELIKKEITPKDVFKPNGLASVIAGVDAKVAEFQAETKGADLSVKKNRDKIKSFAYQVSRSKTFVDDKGKDFVAQIKQQTKEIDEERKRFRDIMDKYRDDVKAPVIEWEKAEAFRVSKIQDRISLINRLSIVEDLGGVPLSEYLKGKLEELEVMTVSESEFHEFTDEAESAYEITRANLERMHKDAVTREEEQAELERLRKEAEERREKEETERAEREKKEREERIRREAEEKAKAEAERKIREAEEAAARAEKQAKEAAERAEREKIEAAERARCEAEEAAREKEQKRLAKEAAERKEAERKAANKRHRASVNNKALDSMKEIGISEEQGRELIIMIAKGLIPEMSMNY